ncbi:SDR family oxidoreductase [Nocardia sp. CDC160]|uniref:SDR family oxidoreductase n=1 Tax=Nocardia sp. CDC160 TaxID=3112166 RepID=UPI002DB78021|nr:NAD(P)H-binding protein [Nocardia sp. CDC160]MEC3917624.1 NAD(P)H-binding protein [Nocardia sp. CDC160]
MYLVTGATGNVGREIVRRLVTAGVPVRATSRNPATSGLPTEVDIVAPQWDSLSMAGVKAVFFNPAAVHDTADALLAQAISAGVRRIVLLSSSSVLDDHPANFTGRLHRELEQRVTRTDLEWTFLRAGMFASNTSRWAESIRQGGPVRVTYGDVRFAPIHEQDLAAAAVRALLSDSLIGTAPVLTGPGLTSQAEQVKTIGHALGVSLQFEELSPRTAHESMVAQQVPPAIAGSLLRYFERALSHPIEPTPISRESAGELPRDYERWVADHIAEFQQPTTVPG